MESSVMFFFKDIMTSLVGADMSLNPIHSHFLLTSPGLVFIRVESLLPGSSSFVWNLFLDVEFGSFFNQYCMAGVV